LEGTRLPSEDVLAAEWSVNRHTAHRALHELQRTGHLIRQRRWGTVVAPRKRRRLNRIGFLVAIGYGSFVGELMRAVERNLGEDVHLVIADTQDDPQREAWHLRRMRDEVDGILCFPTGGPESATVFREFLDDGFPVVMIDRSPPGLEQHVVLSDHADATYRAVNSLIAKGHRRIAFFCGDNVQVQSVRERYEGYDRALGALGVSDPEALVRRFPIVLEQAPHRLISTMTDVLREFGAMAEPPTAVFCVQDYLLIGVMEACEQLGIQVPERFEVAGFNDCPPVNLRVPWRLNRVTQRTDELGRIAVERLNALIEGQTLLPGPIRVPAQFHSAEAGAPCPFSSPSPVFRGLSTTDASDTFHEIIKSLYIN
jgi:DNA-binding LacI/PurR family transcriptional regulator